MIELQEEPALAKITRDSTKITVEQVHGLMSQVYNYSNALSFLLIPTFIWIIQMIESLVIRNFT